jgi:hypothetical protein
MSPAGATEAYGYFIPEGAEKLVADLLRLSVVALDGGLESYARAVRQIARGFTEDLLALSVQAASYASLAVIAKMFESQASNRPHTGAMETHVRSVPGPWGIVCVGLISELEKIINARGAWGPFWMAQEFGTTHQAGRLLFGTFYESGKGSQGTPPDENRNTDLAFVPMGDAPGWGRISRELPARHFLRDGGEQAGKVWKDAVEEIQGKWLAQLVKAGEQRKAAAAQSRFYKVTINY